MNNWENIKLDKDTETLIDKCKYHPELLKLSDEQLKVNLLIQKLELIYNEILIRQQKYIEAFDNLGCFYYIEQHVNIYLISIYKVIKKSQINLFTSVKELRTIFS